MSKEKGLYRKRFGAFCALALTFVMSLNLAGCAQGGTGAEGSTATTDPETVIEAPKASSADLYCLEFNTFSGAYVEDGKNEKVEDVAAILVENRSEAFLDRATVKYKYGDETATFLVTGLPAGQRCWVMEAGKFKPDGKSSCEFEDCTSAFKEDAVLATDKLKTESKDNVLTVTNISEQTLNDVCVYYKNTADDGAFLGGITYMISFDTLAPGEELEKASGHFSETSKIVRYSFREES